MITVIANARRITCMTDDLITSGSIGIPVEFELSEDFDDLQCMAIFQGSGTQMEVALMVDRACVVPSEVVEKSGGNLRIGIYGRDGAGTVVIPTIYANVDRIRPGVAPDGVTPSPPTPDWTAQVQEAAAEALEIAQNIQEMADAGEFDGEPGPRGIQGPQGAPGTPGQDGVSPVASVTQTSTGATITITDAEGTTTAEISNGQDGAPGSPGAPGTDGISPTIAVTDITGGHRVTITDATGPHSFEVMDGEDYVLTQQDKKDIAAEVDVPVQDVQVNGTSILDNGVANVPKATTTQYGVSRYAAAYGMSASDTWDTPRIYKATDGFVKAGEQQYTPITPYNQHISTFYGLAKAAGSDMASSSNPVGTYTDEAKVAIQKMLGVYREWELIADVTVTEDSELVNVDTDISGQPFELSEMLVRAWFEQSTTGTNDYVTARNLVTTKTDTYGWVSSPTLRYLANGAKTFFEYKSEILGGISYSFGSASNGPGSTASVNKLSAVSDTSKCYRGFSFIQYASNATLVPAGTVIKIYGIRI